MSYCYLDSTPVAQEVEGVAVDFLLGAVEVVDSEFVVHSVAQGVLETA